ncbi:FAD-binding oxidoreductase [Geodermatophilus sp. SYSU D00758]
MHPAPAVLPPDLAALLRGRLSPSAGLTDGAVVRPAGPEDVVAAVRLAGRHGVAVAVGGDGVPPAAGRLLRVDPSALDGLDVSAGGWARVGAGVRWQRLLDAAAPLSLAPVTGASPAERVADSVTGGGVGPLARTYGLASDRVRAVELVTGDGVLRRVTPDSEPELFWAVRGGGAALGVLTAVEVDLLPVGPLYAGALRWPASDAAAVLRAWGAWAATLPIQAGTAAVLHRPRRGAAGVAVRFAWAGEPDDGADVLAPLRAAARPSGDDVGVRTSAQLEVHPAGPRRAVESSLLLDALPEQALGPLLRAARGIPPRLLELRLLGGAVSWLPQRPSAVGSRDARLALRVVGGAGADERAATRACADELAAALGPLTGGRAPAHGSGPSPDVLARTPAPAVRDRLAAVAAATDPHRILEGARPGLPVPVPR